MKPLFVLLCLLFSSYGWANPINKEPILLNLATGMTIEYIESEETRLFKSVTFIEENHELHFQTNSTIKYVQIFGENGEVKFQLPVESKHMVFKKNLLAEGQYNIGFRMENDPNLHLTQITSR